MNSQPTTHNSSLTTHNLQPIELATFYVGEALCGMDIKRVQEINKVTDVTPVPQAPEYVKGILNLRGQIVTILDLGEKVGIGATAMEDQNRVVIVRDKDEAVGLLVSKMGDVLTEDRGRIEATPSNMGVIQSEAFEGVIDGKDGLVGILKIDKVLEG
jgi:purine-binding chemotaxis protein CheW